MSKTTVARRIALRLFRNGDGKDARRLVLEMGDGRNGGGWAVGPVLDIIIQELAAEEKAKRAAKRRALKRQPNF